MKQLVQDRHLTTRQFTWMIYDHVVAIATGGSSKLANALSPAMVNTVENSLGLESYAAGAGSEHLHEKDALEALEREEALSRSRNQHAMTQTDQSGGPSADIMESIAQSFDHIKDRWEQK